MKKFLNLLLAATLASPNAFARGKIQNEDVKSLSDIQSAITITGNLSSGSACIASPSSTTGISAGLFVYDATTPANVGSGVTVLGVPGTCSAGQIQLSANAAGSATGDTITFGGQKSQLINDTKLYVTANSINDTLSNAIVNGQIGGGAGTKNYLATSTFASTGGGSANPGNGDFEKGTTTGWSLKNSTISGSTPTTAPTGAASGTLSLTTISSSQLQKKYSASLSNSGSGIQGDMLISNAFNIDTEDQAKMMQIKFYYQNISGSTNFSGTSSNTYAIWIYDVTNAAWIQPQGVYNMVQSSGVGYATATFQTTSNSTQYQLAIIQVNAPIGAYTTYFDDFFVGPQIAPTGSPVSDWVNYGAMQLTSSSAYTFAITSAAVQIGWQYTNNSQTFTSTTTGTVTSFTAGGTGTPAGPGGTLTCVTASGCSANLSYTGTPTASVPAFGSGAINNVWVRRVGGNAEVRWEYKQSNTGTQGTGQYMFYMPTSFPFQFDTTKFTNQTAANGISSGSPTYPTNALGSFTATMTTSSSVLSGEVQVLGGPSGSFFMMSGTAGSSSAGTPGVIGSGYIGFNAQPMSLTMTASVPVLGWQSNVNMSNDTDTRVVSLFANKSAGAVTANTAIPTWTNVVKDTHAAFNSGTGVYTVPVSGDYYVSMNVWTNSASVTGLILKNGSIIISGTRSTITLSGAASGIVNCVAGDTITVASDASVTLSTSAVQTTLSIFRLSGPAVIAATESVNMRYTDSTTTAIGTAFAIYGYGTKVYDSHNAYNSGTGNYTCPVSGKYHVSAGITTAAVTLGTSNYLSICVAHNGTCQSAGSTLGNGVSNTYNAQVSDDVACLAGETIAINVRSGVATTNNSGSIGATFGSSQVAIERVGN